MQGKPSGLYGGAGWKAGLAAVRWIPGKEFLASLAGDCYRVFKPERARVLEENLKPLGGNSKLLARKLFQNFGRKLVDLWLFENGENFGGRFAKLEGWEYFEQARSEGRGVLLATIHLGNWEVGASLFVSKGIELAVLTAQEPDEQLTMARSNARLKHGIETFVVGNDPFSFVAVIQKLSSGGVVAALIDRPFAESSVSVEMFGRRLNVSTGPVELARASGCAVLPVFIVQGEKGYEATILPELKYVREELRNPEAKQQFSADLMRAFEPALKQHPDQWYQFVPVWL